MRKEKNLKILPLILASFVLTIFISGCRKNENTASNVSATSEIAQSLPTGEEISSNTVSSEITSQEQSSSDNVSQQSSSSAQSSSQNSSFENEPSKSNSSSGAVSSENKDTTAHVHRYKTEKVDATCTSSGYIKKICECGQSFSEKIEALGHSFGKWQVIINPSTTQCGLKQRVCALCDYCDKQQTDKLPLTNADMQQEVFRLVNEERAKAGLSALTYKTEAQAAADMRADEIKVSFSHTRPDGRSCFTVFSDLGLRYMSMGENIAKGQTTPQQVVNSWMNSSGHRANILSEKFTSIVVGFENNHWVQLFMS